MSLLTMSQQCFCCSGMYWKVISYDIAMIHNMLKSNMPTPWTAKDRIVYEHISANAQNIRWLAWNTTLGKKAKIQLINGLTVRAESNTEAAEITPFAEYSECGSDEDLFG